MEFKSNLDSVYEDLVQKLNTSNLDFLYEISPLSRFHKGSLMLDLFENHVRLGLKLSCVSPSQSNFEKSSLVKHRLTQIRQQVQHDDDIIVIRLVIGIMIMIISIIMIVNKYVCSCTNNAQMCMCQI